MCTVKYLERHDFIGLLVLLLVRQNIPLFTKFKSVFISVYKHDEMQKTAALSACQKKAHTDHIPVIIDLHSLVFSLLLSSCWWLPAPRPSDAPSRWP